MVKVLFFVLICQLIFASTPGDLIKLGSAYAENDEPSKALFCYQQALQTADASPLYCRCSLFGIGRMHLWLCQYDQALQAYCALLKGPLESEDRELAFAGLLDSLSFSDRPLWAYHLSKQIKTVTNCHLVAALIRADLWSGHPVEAKRLFCCHKNCLDELDSSTHFSKTCSKLIQEVVQESATYHLIPQISYERDSDEQSIARLGVTASRLWSDCLKTDLFTETSAYSIPGGSLGGFTVGGAVHTRSYGNLQSTFLLDYSQYGSWSLIEPEVRLFIQPNDFWSLSALFSNSAVENTQALQNHIRVSFLNLEGRVVLSRYFTLTVSPFLMRFNDDNFRKGVVMSGLISLPGECNLSLEPRVVYYDNTNTDTFGYFNPSSFNEEDLFLLWKKQLTTGARIYLLAGGGLHSIHPGGQSLTFTGEGGIEGYLTPCLAINGYAGYSNSGFNASMTYQRAYIGLGLDYYFN